MSILKNKIDFVALVAVNGANPNGDPNAENMPRVDDEMYGEISSGCIHRVSETVCRIWGITFLFSLKTVQQMAMFV